MQRTIQGKNIGFISSLLPTGGNYGWNLREAAHAFTRSVADQVQDHVLI